MSLPDLGDLYAEENEMRNALTQKLSWHREQISRGKCVSFEVESPALFVRQQMGRSTQILRQHLGLSKSPGSVHQMFLQERWVGSIPHLRGELDISREVIVGEGSGRDGEEGGSSIFSYIFY